MLFFGGMFFSIGLGVVVVFCKNKGEINLYYYREGIKLTINRNRL